MAVPLEDHAGDLAMEGTGNRTNKRTGQTKPRMPQTPRITDTTHWI